MVCGGALDRETLLNCGYSIVTISNLNERLLGDGFAPFEWSSQDAEQLSFPDDSFDYCIEHDGLHHCASPHRALLEMYRVARQGILVFESRDSALVRTAIALKRIQSHEIGWGTLRDSNLPNYVYRWKEREVEKTVSSYAPHAPHKISFFYGLRIPSESMPFYHSKKLGWISVALESAIKLFVWMFPKQGNRFAFYIPKPSDEARFPWLKSRTEFDEHYRSSHSL